jgi:hypothetical protein
MGIRGVRSLLDADPSRYCETLKFNWDESSSDESITILVDAMALLYHVTMRSGKTTQASPATVRELVSDYTLKLLRVVGENGAVHMFLDGLAPKEKISTQMSRLQEQHTSCDLIAKRNTTHSSAKALHILAEWAFVEAIQDLQKTIPDSSRFQLHRACKGEGEAYIDHWIEHHASPSSKVVIVSDDSDFFIYPSCPGYVPCRSIKFEEHDGKLCMQGQHYLRSKFLKSFLPNNVTNGDASKSMAAIAAIAGCDYSLGEESDNLLVTIRKRMVESDLGGLRKKQRGNPSASLAMTAMLRVVAYYVKRNLPDTWINVMFAALVPKQLQLALDAIDRIQKIYFEALDITASEDFTMNPASVDTRRLLQCGTMYCTPIIETWKEENQGNSHPRRRKRPLARPDSDSANTDTIDTMVPTPPLKAQFDAWVARGSIWQLPQFQQLRVRLYSLLKLAILNGKARSENMEYDERWAQMPSDTTKGVTEVVRVGTGINIRVSEKCVNIPDPKELSTGYNPSTFEQDSFAGDDALLFCIFGNQAQSELFQNEPVPPSINYVLFWAAMTLPSHLACLLILLGTAPSHEGITLPPPSSLLACEEVDQILPLISVAIYHALLLGTTVSTIFPKATNPDDMSSTLWMLPSDVLRNDNVLLIWDALRAGKSESLDDTDSVDSLLDEVFLRLSQAQPVDEPWKLLVGDWQKTAMPVWTIWCKAFHIGQSVQ